MQVYVNYNFHRHFESSDEPYGDWYGYRFGYEFDSITKEAQSHSYESITLLPNDVQVGDILYFVWVEYSSGDSFGHETGLLADIGAYNTKEKADLVVQTILKTQNEKETTIFDDPDGLPISSSAWTGYFQRFEDVHIEELIYEG